MRQATTVVTGGSSGIGEAICQRLLALGHHVVNVDIVAPADVARRVLSLLKDNLG